MLNWRLRYQPFIEAIDDASATPTVLDVGSGWFGLSWFWPHLVVQTDLHFDGDAPRDSRPGEVHYVCAAAERLPFADDAFDVVLSSDMLEHLPEASRAVSVSELTRVARARVIVGFPTGTPARLLDHFYARLLRTLRRPLPQWLLEHLNQEQYPDQALVERALPANWHVASAQRNGNLFVQALVLLAEMVPVAGRLLQNVERRLVGRKLPRWLHLPPTVRAIVVLRPDDS